jgi:pilus assembly protein CpaC
MMEGQTLALAGLLSVNIDATTSRIPFMGDLPYVGPFFSNNSHQNQEKELLILVTPVLVSPIPEGECVPYPTEEISDPNDNEFFFLGRIEGRTGRPFRSTLSWANPLGLVERMKLERDCLNGDMGFSR